MAAEESVVKFLKSGKPGEKIKTLSEKNLQVAKGIVLDAGIQLEERNAKNFLPFFLGDHSLQIPSNQFPSLPIAIVLAICVYWFGDMDLGDAGSLMEDLDYAYGTSFVQDWRDLCRLP